MKLIHITLLFVASMNCAMAGKCSRLLRSDSRDLIAISRRIRHLEIGTTVKWQFDEPIRGVMEVNGQIIERDGESILIEGLDALGEPKRWRLQIRDILYNIVQWDELENPPL